MLTLLALASSQAAPITDFSENFDASERAAFVGPTIPWAAIYPADTWSTLGPLDGREGVYCLTDDEGGAWGTGAPVDNHLVYTDRQWRDLTLTALVRDDGDDGVGFVFRYLDRANLYIWVMADGDKVPAVGGGSASITGSRLYRVRNGVAVELASSAARNERTRWEHVRVVLTGNRIQAYLDANNDNDALDAGDLVFDVTDTAANAIGVVGRVGVHCYNSGAEGTGFDDLAVTIDDADPDSDGVPDARDLCPGVFDVQADLDGDRLGDACDPDADADGAAKAGGDCNDLDAAVFPGAPEACDLVDQDCDGSVVESFGDLDGDNAPDCVDPDDDGDGSLDTKDCAPVDKTRSPGAIELCDSVDQDCDGDLIDGFPDTDGDKTADCLDTDDDGDGSLDALDCRPLDDTVRPGAVEVCDAIDQDCDGDLVEGFGDANGNLMPDCADVDDDGDGDPDVTDCAPLDSTRHAGAAETCDGKDQDCDGAIDDNATDASDWFADDDGDKHGSPADLVRACVQPGGRVTSSDDCDDLSSDVSPDAVEACNGFDDDCDGWSDDLDPEGVLSAPLWYADADGDGFVEDGVFEQACEAPDGFLAQGKQLDCDDDEALVNPDAEEVACNEVDDDCDQVVDSDAAGDPPSWWVDGDGDGFGDASSAAEHGCAPPGAGYVGNDGDCDDASRDVSPESEEVVGNDVDDDCDPGSADEGPVDTDGGRPFVGDSLTDTGLAPVGEACGCATPAAVPWLGLLLVPSLLRRRCHRPDATCSAQRASTFPAGPLRDAR